MKALAVIAALLLWAVATPANAGQGVYLMMAPRHCMFDPNHPFDPPKTCILIGDYNAPLHLWEQFRTYDSARECQNDLYGFRRDAQMFREARERVHREKTTGEETLEHWAMGKCVMADDPRLVAAPSPTPSPAPPSMKEPQNPFLNLLNQEKPGLPKAGGVIRYTPGRPIIAVVRLNGRSSARLILDTGADGSMVKPDVLANAGVDLSRPEARGEASGITGKVQVSYFTVDFEVAGHRARVTHVAAFNRYDDDFADGLLGRDFLDRFKVVMDPAAGTVTLLPR